ncbi:MAG: phosphotransferase [Bryobacteraceae bacterium]|nr:phosphotransferase [Bryobacteraceae bacterium]
MFELLPVNASDYLAARPETRGRRWTIAPLGGGVSNTVLLAESADRRIVLKQALPKLRVEEDWFADRTRIHRECAAMRLLAPYLAPGCVPEIVFEDPENCLFAMSAAPAAARTWKTSLLDGATDEATAGRIGAMMSDMVRAGWQSERWRSIFGDLAAFDQLRLDPYYRFTASRHPDLAEHFHARIGEARTRTCSLVHGDWSPKNFLVAGDSVMAIDFEVIHFGDPSFDSGFLLNHLALKSFYRPPWASRYATLAHRFFDAAADGLPSGAEWFEPATCRHLACLLLARIDGKSPAEYIREPELKERIRSFARTMIPRPPATVAAFFEKLRKCL